VFGDHLRASIEEIGLAEPLKVVPLEGNRYLIVDGILRWGAISAIRRKNPQAFQTVPVYILPFKTRFEIRYQSDIYQDLLPSQLASLVEHLHESEQVSKRDIARYIGISSATLRNYTGLWRLKQRGGLFEKIVDLMDAGVLPSSNPYAWLRLTESGLHHVLGSFFATDQTPDEWIEEQIAAARSGRAPRITLLYVEASTRGLLPEHYREAEAVRTLKRSLGLRRSGVGSSSPDPGEDDGATSRLNWVASHTNDLVVRTAAESLQGWLNG
jgi:hypothetical protein